MRRTELGKLPTLERAVRLLAAMMVIAAIPYPAGAQDIVSCANVPEEAAIPFCTRAIESGMHSGRDLAGLYLNRGLRYAVKKDKERALADYDKATEIDPDFAKPYNNRGALYFDQFKDSDLALENYDEAIELDPKYPMAYDGRAKVYSDKGDYQRAIEDFNEAIKLNPQYALAYYNRAITYVRMGEFDKAFADANQAMKFAPKAWQPTWARGVVQFASGKLDLAIADYNAVLQLNPKNADALYARGLAKLKKGDSGGGDADVAAAKAIKPDIAEDWLNWTRITPDGAQVAVAPAPPVAERQSVPHAGSCTRDSWGFLSFHGFEFGTVNSCEETVSIWFRRQNGSLKKATAKFRGVFTTGYDADTYGGRKWSSWISATCPAGHEPSPRLSFRNEQVFTDGKYKCVATR